MPCLILIYILLLFNLHFCALVYRAAYAGSGWAAGHGEGPDQVQKEVPGDGADGPGREGKSRYGGKVCLLSTADRLCGISSHVMFVF